MKKIYLDSKEFKDMQKRFKVGDPITDAELEVLLDHYTILTTHLEVEGERYHFTWRDARDQRDRLEGFREARKRDTKCTSLRDLNRIAKQFDLELVKGSGYFYWSGTTEEMKLKTAGLYSTSVYVYRFNHLTWDRWIEELESIKSKLK